MKKCCGLCPFSRIETLFVHPERAEEFAYSTENPYNDFVCHKTGIIDEDNPDEDKQNEIVRGEKSLICCGFASMQHNINSEHSEEGFIPDEDAFSEAWEMIEHHQIQWDKEHKILQ